MPLTRIRNHQTLIVISVSLLIASCSFEQAYNRYQTPGTEAQVGREAVAELHRHALAALNRQSYQQAIDLLQRALRIEPRDARSWHYLAQTYWRRGDLERCSEMVERSLSYSSSEDDLDVANQNLLKYCRRL